MRMWMVDPQIMCRQHLLGEHKELHMLVGSVRRGRSLRGHIEKGQLQLSALHSRHEALAAEIERRNWDHSSPLLETASERGYWLTEVAQKQPLNGGEVDAEASRELLITRCSDCFALYHERCAQHSAGAQTKEA